MKFRSIFTLLFLVLTVCLFNPADTVAQADLIGMYTMPCNGDTHLMTTVPFQEVEIYLVLHNPTLGGVAGWEAKVEIDGNVVAGAWTLAGGVDYNSDPELFTVGVGIGVLALRPGLGCNEVLLASFSGYVVMPTDQVTFRILPFPGSVTFDPGPGYVDPDDPGVIHEMDAAFDPAFTINIEPPVVPGYALGIDGVNDGQGAWADVGNIAGFKGDASDGHDSYDVMANDSHIYFQSSFGNLDEDIRGLYDPLTSMKQWTFVTEVDYGASGGSSNLVLTFNDYLGDYSGVDTKLYDREAMIWTDLNVADTYGFSIPFNYGTYRRTFDLYLGKMPVSGFAVQVDGRTSYADAGPQFAGAADDAGDGYDPGGDIPSPPLAPEDFLRVSFEHDDWNTPFGDFWSQDIRALFDTAATAKTWLMRVDADGQDPVTLTFTPSFAQTAGIGLYLRNHETGSLVDLFGAGLEIVYTPAYNGVNYFDLIVGAPGVPDLNPVSRTVPGGWSMIGAPLVPTSNTVNNVILGLAPYPSYVFAHDPASGYGLVDANNPVQQGRGYWIAASGGFDWTMDGERDLDGVEYPLEEGWNLIGYPLWSATNTNGVTVHYLDDYGWGEAAAMGLISEHLLDYEEVSPGVWGYEPTDMFQTWHGYWVWAANTGISLRFDINNVVTSKQIVYDPFVDSPDESWRVDVKLMGTESILVFGETPISDEGFDGRLDMPTYPSKPDGSTGPVMYFERPDLDLPNDSRLTRDFRSSTAKSTLGWDATIVAPEPGPVTLNWRAMGLDVADRDLQIYLPQQNRVVVMSMASERSVTLDVGAEPLIVQFRTPSMSGVQDLQPLQTSITCAPNPFNPSTLISFTTALAGRADVKIYNVQGKLVRTLAVGQVEPGRYDVRWMGQDTAGRSVSSGTYFAILHLDGRNTGAIRKMSLVR